MSTKLMTHQERGAKGGKNTAANHAPTYFKEIGRLGGLSKAARKKEVAEA